MRQKSPIDKPTLSTPKVIMPLNRQPDHESRDFVQDQPLEPPDHETRRLNDADQFRADLKAETGYSSYSQYLNASERSRREYSILLRHMEDPIFPQTYNNPTSLSTCFILDLSRGPGSQPDVNLRCKTSSGAETLKSLRHPPDTSSVQIVLWLVTEMWSDLTSALGLGLKVDVSYFDTVCDRIIVPDELRRSESSGLYHMYEVGSYKYGRRLKPAHVEVGGDVVTIVGHHDADRPLSVPVVLVAGRGWQIKDVVKEIGDVLPLLDSATGETAHEKPSPHPWWRYPDEISDYVRLLHWCLENRNERTGVGTNASLLFTALLPLIYRSTSVIQKECHCTRDSYPGRQGFPPLDSAARDEVDSRLHKLRLFFRRLVEQSKDDSEYLTTYTALQRVEGWKEFDAEVQTHYKRVHTSALRLDAEVRDYLQLQAGEMALQESRKSLELSSLQIEESKRGSVFLSFVNGF